MGTMHNTKMLTILILGVLLLGSSGIITVSAASGQSVFGSGDMGASYFTDPSFLSPDWSAAPVTSSFADPSFLSPNWSAAPVTSSFADPSFLSPDWSVPNLNKPA